MKPMSWGQFIDSKVEGHVLVVPFPSGLFSMAPGASFAIVAAWILGLMALTFRVFRRQDIN